MNEIPYGTDEEPTSSASRDVDVDDDNNGVIIESSNNYTKSKTLRSTPLRTGVRMKHMADHRAVEGEDSNEEKTKVKKNSLQLYKPEDIIKIFVDKSSNDYIEVTKEQLQRVKDMHERMEDGASFSFNYNTLLIVASILAGLGLVSNSGTTIIASMLVSPIMGPVVGMAYGSSIRDWKLVRRSIISETVSLFVCIIMGMIIAGCTGRTTLADDWPTPEMYTRGTWQNFFVALPIAFFSGLGVAVSLLDDQTSSLVGVAISASLLPPAVNTGILLVAYKFETDCSHDDIDCSNTTLQGTYADHVRYGIISLFLTIANIILICISGMLMFRMKEVLPIEKKKVFWQDLGVARKIYQQRAFIVEGNTTSENDIIVTTSNENVSVFANNIDNTSPKGDSNNV